MNFFRLNNWIYLLFYTIPCVFLSQITNVVLVVYLLFWITYLLFLFNRKIINQSFQNVFLRNKIECVFLIAIFISELCNLSGNLYLLSLVKNLYSILYFIIIIDISYGFRKYVLHAQPNVINKITVVLIFFCFVVPPLGIYYLKKLYKIANNNLSIN